MPKIKGLSVTAIFYLSILGCVAEKNEIKGEWKLKCQNESSSETVKAIQDGKLGSIVKVEEETISLRLFDEISESPKKTWFYKVTNKVGRNYEIEMAEENTSKIKKSTIVIHKDGGLQVDLFKHLGGTKIYDLGCFFYK